MRTEPTSRRQGGQTETQGLEEGKQLGSLSKDSLNRRGHIIPHNKQCRKAWGLTEFSPLGALVALPCRNTREGRRAVPLARPVAPPSGERRVHEPPHAVRTAEAPHASERGGRHEAAHLLSALACRGLGLVVYVEREQVDGRQYELHANGREELRRGGGASLVHRAWLG